MGMTMELGQTAAYQLAKRNLKQYDKADARYGSIIDAYLGQVPRPILISHILRINASLLKSPKFKDYRRGFMGVSPLQASNAEVDMTKILGDPAVCAYVYSRELNRVSYNLYTTYPTLFTETKEDFWRCAYLRVTLGDPSFFALWNMHPPVSTDESIYDVLRYSVNNMNKSLMGISAQKIKVLILRDCEFVFQLAVLKGNLRSEGAGIEPVPSSRNAAGMFTRSRNG